MSFAQDGVFANAESVEEIEAFAYWPNPDYVNFNWFLFQHSMVEAKDYAVFSGTWAPVWHILMDFFGMENCFVKMYTHPDVIKAVMKKMVDFYLEVYRRFFDEHADKVDVFFFGNDMGSQLDCMISPAMFRELIFPYYRQLIDLAKSYGKKVALHSCGSVDRIIPDIIEMGVDVLHPIQAKAAHMDAEHLHAAYGSKIIFLGGVDTQQLRRSVPKYEVNKRCAPAAGVLANITSVPQATRRLLPNVSPEKLLIMSKTATINHLNDKNLKTRRPRKFRFSVSGVFSYQIVSARLFVTIAIFGAGLGFPVFCAAVVIVQAFLIIAVEFNFVGVFGRAFDGFGI